jgi:hypothetical protein
MFQQLKQKMGLRALTQWLKTNTSRIRTVHTIASAKTIGLLFDATQEATRRDCLAWADQLTKEGKKVSLLAYYDVTKPLVPAPQHTHFIAKELDFSLRPKSVKAAEFVKERFDLLLSINPNEQLPLAWAAAQSCAAMKIGWATELPNDLDIQIDTPNDRGITYFIAQLKAYLSVIR